MLPYACDAVGVADVGLWRLGLAKQIRSEVIPETATVRTRICLNRELLC
jgi:hypothetical protein